MRIGVLGLGRIGAVHARNLAALADVESVVVFDTATARAERFADEVEVEVASDAGDLVGRADAVVVCTPTASHPEDIALVAAAGAPIFCEKPISLDLDTTRSAIDRAAEAGVELQVGFMRRFDPGFAEARRRVESGELGTVYVIRAASHDHEPPHEAYLGESGSIFRDMHIHDFDAVRWLSGQEVVDVTAKGSVLVDEMFERHGDVDTSGALLTLDGGAIAVLTGARHDAIGYDHRTEVFGSRDSVCAGFEPRMPLRSSEPGAPEPVEPYPSFPVRFGPAYAAEMRAFVDLVAGHGPNRCPGESAFEALRVAIAAERSLAEGRTVPLSEIEGSPDGGGGSTS